MINLTDYVKKEAFLPISHNSKEQVLKALIDRCLATYSQELKTRAYEQILDLSSHELSGEIPLGDGFALMHTRIEQVTSIHVVIGILPEPLPLLGSDVIHTVFCVVLPQSESRRYLSFLAKLGRLLRHKEAREAFEQAGSLCKKNLCDEALQNIVQQISLFG